MEMYGTHVSLKLAEDPTDPGHQNKTQKMIFSFVTVPGAGFPVLTSIPIPLSDLPIKPIDYGCRRHDNLSILPEMRLKSPIRSVFHPITWISNHLLGLKYPFRVS